MKTSLVSHTENKTHANIHGEDKRTIGTWPESSKSKLEHMQQSQNNDNFLTDNKTANWLLWNKSSVLP